MRLSFLRRLGRRRTQVIVFLGILGPGLITSTADNDAGGIFTYAQAGARYGYDMIWLLAITTIALAVVQEFNARLGVVTGKGLADLIRERFGVPVTVLAMVLLIIANVATAVAEFAGIALAGDAFNISRYITVPLAAIVVWFLVLRGSYAVVEKIFLALSVVYFTYIASGVIVHPPWAEVLQHSVAPHVSLSFDYLLLSVALVGTTITPWMQFYLQSSVVDKGLRAEEIQYERADVFIGSVITDVIAFFIIVATAATLHATGHTNINDARDAAQGLVPVAGQFAKLLFVVGLVGASLLAASVLPLSTAYAVTEAFGWERGVGRTVREAPAFFVIFTGLIVVGALTILVPGVPLAAITILSQDVDGIILPAILVFMFVLVNDRRLLGRYANGRFANIFGGATIAGIIALTVLLLVSSLPGVHLGG
ncbi:MAG TPA: Nramp family divalent metal transporter [Candidatus Dormibacteraeota bacterium]|nr:Nramp family divalent metal transporter [Candidatus Dormibacteraeota bacterium]